MAVDPESFYQDPPPNGASDPAQRQKVDSLITPIRIHSAIEFTDGFVAPDYIVDGLIQRGYLYSCTALTSHGKTAVALALAFAVATGERLGNREVEKGRVLYLAGENADDVRARTIIMADKLGIDLSNLDIDFIDRPFRIKGAHKIVAEELEKRGGADLVVVDTAAAFFDGEDENNNVDQGNFARSLRHLNNWPGNLTRRGWSWMGYPIK
jgi:RecA-family ATPase